LYHDRHNKQSRSLPLKTRVTRPEKAHISKHTGQHFAASFGSKSNNYHKNSSTGKNEVQEVPTAPKVVPLTRKDTSTSNMSSDTIAATPYEDLDTEGLMQEQHRTQSHDKEPRLSWTVTLGSMVIATVVSSTGPGHTEISFVDDHFRL